MVAEVIINSSVKTLNRTFDYEIPPAMDIHIGSRVFIPFGNKKSLEEGIVIGIKENFWIANNLKLYKINTKNIMHKKRPKIIFFINLFFNSPKFPLYIIIKSSFLLKCSHKSLVIIELY